MLDDCKGERLEEILAVFSSTVLKKVVEEEQLNSGEHITIAPNLALEKRGYAGERAELTPLVLAHKASLRKKLDQKNAARVQYCEFAQLLDSKERDIITRQETVKAYIEKHENAMLSENEKAQVRCAVRNNWTGNETWMDALLHGDAKSQQDGLLTAPFDRVWRCVRMSRLGELESQNVGLLEQLNGRVHAQKARLDEWQKFRKEMFGDVSSEPERKSSTRIDRQKGIDLGFGVHESLQLDQSSPRNLVGVQTAQLHGEYDTLLEAMDTELKEINQGQAARPVARWRECAQHVKCPTQSSCGEKPVEEPLSELSELEEDLAHPPAPRGRRSRLQDDDLAESPATFGQPSKRNRVKLSQPLSSQHAFRPKLQPTEISPTEILEPRVPSPRRSPMRQPTNKSPSPTRLPTRALPPSPQQPPPSQSPILRTKSPEELLPSPTQQQANQILASMHAASPSPVKQSRTRHTLSLAERTRLSMVRGAGEDLDGEDGLVLGSPSPTRMRRRNTSSRSPTKHKPSTPTTTFEDKGADDIDAGKIPEEDDLVARTRKSMANFEAAQQKARLERERSLKRAARQQSGSIARQSYFPSLGEEENSDTVVLDQLIAEDGEGVDYEAVFKSRPKIKTSPPSTPVRGSDAWE